MDAWIKSDPDYFFPEGAFIAPDGTNPSQENSDLWPGQAGGEVAEIKYCSGKKMSMIVRWSGTPSVPPSAAPHSSRTAHRAAPSEVDFLLQVCAPHLPSMLSVSLCAP